MRELESMLQQFGEFLLKARLVKENASIASSSGTRRQAGAQLLA